MLEPQCDFVKRNENLKVLYHKIKMNHPDFALNRALDELEQRYIELFSDFLYFTFSYISLIMLNI